MEWRLGAQAKTKGEIIVSGGGSALLSWSREKVRLEKNERASRGELRNRDSPSLGDVKGNGASGYP